MNRKKLNEILKEYFDLKNSEIRNVVIDSRQVNENDLFIAIRGGNNFVEEALNKGAYVVFDEQNLNIKTSKALFVKDSIEFIQNLATKYRKVIAARVVSITGSNGKTTTKDIVHELLSLKFKGKKTEGNYNNHIGLPLTLLRVEDDDEYIVLEMGMSALGEIKLLSEISRPDYALITNIGDSHLEYLINRDNVFKAKTEVIPYIQKSLLVNGDDLYLKNLNAFKAGKENNNDLILKKLDLSDEGSNFTLNFKNKEIYFKTNLIGEHNIYNISLALLLCSEFGVELLDFKDKLNNLNITGMRFEVIEKEKITYINDAYNASPVSMKFALETYSKIHNDKFKIAVLGDMLELGEKSQEMHENLAKSIIKTNINEIYLYGNEMKYLFYKLLGKTDVYYFDSKAEITEKISAKTKKTAVLLKGSRGMKLEQIIK